MEQPGKEGFQPSTRTGCPRSQRVACIVSATRRLLRNLPRPCARRLTCQRRYRREPAVWVLAAHTRIALLTPLLLLWAVHANWGYVAAQAAVPGLFYVAVALMVAGAAFEIGQNTADRWYLEKGMGSTDSTALADFLFYLCNCLGTLALIAGCITSRGPAGNSGVVRLFQNRILKQPRLCGAGS